eukprot:2418715-Amphidinium_carterae.2
MAVDGGITKRNVPERGRGANEPQAKHQRGAGVYPTPSSVSRDVSMAEQAPLDVVSQHPRSSYRSSRPSSRNQRSKEDGDEETPVIQGRSRSRSERGDEDTPCG